MILRTAGGLAMRIIHPLKSAVEMLLNFPKSAMYTQTAKFEFNDVLPQSERFSFLAGLAAALEKSILPDRPTDNPGFSLELNSKGGVCVTIWHYWKEDVMWSQLRSGHESDAIKVTQPKNFAS